MTTLASYQQKAKPSDPQVHDVKGFLRELFPPECASIMDVYCEPPFRGWKEVADNTELSVNYYFAIGCHPHDAKDYNDQVEQIILDAMKHEYLIPLADESDPRKCKAWGEMGLDYHYNLSPPDVQKRVLIRQLEKAVSLGRNIVIHTREADDDIYEILTKYVPKETHIHIHCFTDTPALAASLLSHFPNLYIGVTGVITYSSNVNTAEAVKAAPLERLLLETDSPFMTPNNAQKAVKELTGKSSRIPVCWSALIPWTAEWVANIKEVSVEKVLEVTTENAKRMYGITV